MLCPFPVMAEAQKTNSEAQETNAEAGLKQAKLALAKEAAGAITVYVAVKKEGIELLPALLRMLEGE
jgi:hypothetical protein